MVGLIIQMGNRFLNAALVLLVDFFLVEIFGNRGQGKAGLPGDIFDRDFHLFLRSVMPAGILSQAFYHEILKLTTREK